MDLVYAAADLLVGRGGASTVAEVAVTGHAVDPRSVGRAPPRITRPATSAGSPTRAPPCTFPRPQLAVSAAAHRRAARSTPSSSPNWPRNAAAAGAMHRRGALGALIERRRPPRTGERRPVASVHRDRLRPPRRWTSPSHVGCTSSASAARACRRSPSCSPRWATPCPAATSASSRCSTACGPPASPSTSGTTAPHVEGCDAVTVVDGGAGEQRRAAPGDRAGHPDAAPGRHVGIDLRPCPRRGRRRHPRQDDDHRRC